MNLSFNKSKTGIKLKGFVDSDFAGNRNDRNPASIYVFTLCDTCISRKSQLQKIVALSLTEAECIALTNAINEGF